MNNSKKSEESTYDRWIWLDLEMTGLDETTCTILQAAMIITDPQFKILAEIDIPIWQPESVLATMIPIVRSMHTKNNLLERVRTSEFSLPQAQDELLKIMTKHCPYQKGVLAGNSIYVDRRFLQKYMPMFESYLHYRQIDVSSLKLLSYAWYGDRGRPPKKSSSHTALEDIHDSINELKFYQERIFASSF